MSGARLIKHYGRIADAPDAIPRLRSFVLDLAIRGKLAPQDPNDEPVAELLKRIAAEKAERKKQTHDARISIEPNPKPADLPMALPQGWAVQSFENLFLFIDYRGNTPPKTNEGIPLITAKNIRMGYLNREPREYISKPTFSTWMTRGFPEIGDLFFTTEAPLAHVCLNDIDEPFALAQRAICLQPYAKIDTKFLMFAIMSDVMQSLIAAHATGLTAKGIKAARLKPLPIPIPPLPEQHRIVAKIGELLALCDRLEAARRAREATRDRLTATGLARLDALDPETFRDDARFVVDVLPALTARADQIKQLRLTILNLAVRGKLVPQDPNEEPASELLKRIAREKTQRVKNGTLPEQRPLPPIEDSEIEFELSQGWQWVRMAEVIKLWNGFAFKSGDFQSAGVPVIRIGNLQNGEVNLSDAVRVPEVVAKAVSPEVWIPPDALLIAMSGATTGKTAFNRTGKPLLLNQRVGRIEVFLMSMQFLRFFFETKVARNLSISFGTAIPNLSAQQINETMLPLPPLAEQHRIAAKVDELMTLCDRLETSLAATDETRRRMLDALLAEALEPDHERELEAAE